MWEHPCLIYRALVSNDSLQLGYVAKMMISKQKNFQKVVNYYTVSNPTGVRESPQNASKKLSKGQGVS